MATKKEIPVVGAGAAADVLDRLAAQYAGIQEAAAALRAVGSAETAIAERNARIKELDKQIEARKGEFTRLNERFAEQSEAMSKQVLDAGDEARAVVAEGREKADGLIAAAGEKATQIVAEARRQADQITSGAHEDARRHTATATAAKVELANAQLDLERVNAEIKAANDQLQTAREKIRELLGAN